jgi:hypothetical protein
MLFSTNTVYISTVLVGNNKFSYSSHKNLFDEYVLLLEIHACSNPSPIFCQTLI